VSGQVFMPDGETPAHDVVVTIGGRGVLSADGSFTIEGVRVSASAQAVAAQSRDGRRSGSTIVIANEPRLYPGLRIDLSGLGNAAFRVLDEKGQPVKGQQVGLLGQCGNPCGCAAATTDADGVAVFRNLSYGHFYAKAIRSTASSSDVASGSLAIVADETTVLTSMRFAGVGRVEGTVRDATDAPVHGADVRLWARRFVYDGVNTCDLQYGYVGGGRTPVAGTYGFTGINLGPVSVSATQDFFGSGAAGNSGTLSEPGQALTLDMKFADTTAGVLSGNVLLPGGAPAAAGIEVAVEGPLPEVKVATDAAGHYEFPHILPEGYYKLTARDPVGGGLARVSVTLKRQEPLSRDVQLKGRGTVRVQVVSGPSDEPVESALVELTETEFPSRSFDQSVRPGNQGTVLFLDVYEGPLKIAVTDAFARSGSATAVLPGPGE
jgi:protocatechuate 3,4-dioxygenase beta subunit